MKNISGLVGRKISPTDSMYQGNERHYFDVGASALANIDRALDVANNQPSTILDFGCGAGRVTRWLAARFTGAKIHACEIAEASLPFVAETFGARTWLSTTQVPNLSAPASYDLIWVGSIVTHLSQTDSTALFDKLFSWLNPSGVLVITSHGRHAARLGPERYGIDARWAQVVAEFEEHGFGYAGYEGTPNYGISMVQPWWWARLVTSRPTTRLLSMSEHSWDEHQDVIAVQKAS